MPPKKYVVEKVLDRRGTGKKLEYYIKWKGMYRHKNKNY